MKHDKFNTEINYIKNSRYKDNIKILIDLLPDYFFEIPAASTGKYHPVYAAGDGGLLRHTKAAVRIAHELLINNSIGHSFTDDEKDLIIMTLILHDGLKSGIEKSQYTKFEHPILIANYIKENKDKTSLNDKEIELICNMVSAHMGEWNTSSYSDIVLPKPSNKYQRFVHMCDYLASKKFLKIEFKDNEIVD